VQVRSAGYAAYNALIDVKPGERQALAHTFVRTQEPARPKPDFWRDLRRKFGS
jgi:hypothetical protein